LQGSGDDADLTDGGHEVDVAGPAWDQVDVEVLRDACPGGAALVDADVDALGGEGSLEDFGSEIDHAPEGGALVGGVVEETGAGFAEGDEKVAAGVGELVEENEAVRTAMDDVVGDVKVRREPVIEQERPCARLLWWRGVDILDVLETPRGKECVGSHGSVLGGMSHDEE